MKLRVKFAAVASAVALSIVGWAIPANAGEYTGMRVLQAVQKEVNDLTSPDDVDEADGAASQDPPPDESSPPADEPEAQKSSGDAKEESTEDAPAPAAEEPAKKEEEPPAKKDAPAKEEAPAKKEAPAAQEEQPAETEKSSEPAAEEEPAAEDKSEAPAQRSAAEVPSLPLGEGTTYSGNIRLKDMQRQYPNLSCYATEGRKSSPHGTVVKSTSQAEWDSVQLKPAPQGYEYEVLAVKGDNAYVVYQNPTTGVLYQTPDRDGKKNPDVSHWIVCKSKTPTQTDVCKNWDGTQTTVPEGMQSDGKGNCWYDVWVCWEVLSDDFDLNDAGEPIINDAWFTPKQKFIQQAGSKAGLKECLNYVPECGTETWFQLDKYKIASTEDEELLERLKRDGLGGVDGDGNAEDYEIWNDYRTAAFVHKTGVDCTATGQVDICQPTGQGGHTLQTITWNYVKSHGSEPTVTLSPQIADGAVHPAIEVRDHNGAVFRTIEASDFDGDIAAYIANNCEPPVTDLCENFEGVQAELPAGWYVKNNGDCAYDVFVCWEIKANVTGQPSEGAANLFDPKQQLKQHLFQNAEGTVTLYSLEDCWDYVPECGTTTWFQLDHYVIDSNRDRNLIDRLLEAGELGWDNGPEDASIYKTHVFVQRNGTDCTNSGTVDVCLPDDSRASGLAPGTISWSYTKNANGTVTVTTDPADLTGVIHDGFTILTHHEPAEEHSTVASTWDGAGSFALFRENGCQTDVDICVPVDNQQERSAGPAGPTNPWTLMTVTQQERVDDYPNAPEPNAQGFCEFEIYICWEIKGGIDLLAWTDAAGAKNPVYVANFSPTPQEYVGWGTSFEDLKDLENCAPEPICGDVTAFQLDLYDIASTEDWDTLLSLIANGLGMDGGSYGDHTIYGGDHLIIKQQADECVQTGTVPVCLPGDSASGLVQGLMTWTYTKNSDGEGYTTDYAGPHPAYTVTNHLDDVFENVAQHAEWNQAFYDNGCQDDVDLCVPVDGQQELTLAAVESPTGATNPWMVITVTEQQAKDMYPNAFAPNKRGFCEYQVYVCWEIQADVDGTPTDGAAYLFDPEQQLVQYVYQDADGSVDFSSLTDCYDDTPRCGDDTWYQLDLYTIDSESDHALLDHLLSTGELGYNGGPEDAQIYTDHVFVKRSGQDCTNTGTVPVCVPDEGSASGYIQGLLTWTYTQTLEGEGFTTDFTGPHPAFTVKNHLDELFEDVAQHPEWNQAFYDNGCQDDVDICVPVDGQQQLTAAIAEGPTGPTNPWMVITVTEQQAKDMYPNAFAPNKKGFCEFEVFVCWEINGGVDLLATTGPAGAKTGVFKANFTPDKQTYVGWGDSFDALKALEDCAPEPVCGEVTAFQLDKYKIASTGHYNTLMELIANGLGMDGSKYADHALYKDHLIIKQVSDPCVNSGTVDVCVPDDNAASGYSTGTVTWTYTKAPDGTETVTIDPTDLTGYLHAGFEVLTHEEPAEVHSAVAATWTSEGPFAEFYDNGCQGNVDICVPAGGETDNDARAMAITDRGYVRMTVTEQEFADYYSDYPQPVNGDDECAPINGTFYLCHAGTPDDEDGYRKVAIRWSAVGDELSFVHPDRWERHSGDGDNHAGDIIPAVTIENLGTELMSFEGRNTDLLYLLVGFDCNPVPPVSAVDYETPTCEDPNVAATYTVTVGSARSAQLEFTLEGTTFHGNDVPARVLGTATRGGVEQVMNLGDLSPGTYTITARSPGSEVVDELFTTEFTIPVPEGCATIDPSVLGGICDANAPYLQWTVVLEDEYTEVEFGEDGTAEAQLTFLHPTDDSQNYSIPVVLDQALAEVLADDPETDADETGWLRWTGVVPWPGTAFVDGVVVEWPGYETLADGTYENVGDGNFGWTRNGVSINVSVNPEVTIDSVAYPAATDDCDVPPVEICVAADDGTGEMSTITADEYDANRDAYDLWDEEAANNGCPEPIDPTLAGSLLSSLCVADSPWLTYNVELTDPQNRSTDDGTATITFVHPTDESQNVEVQVAIGDGYVLWPGASVAPAAGYTADQIDPTNPATFVPTGWPGWAQDATGAWVEVGTNNYGWTRHGIEVRLDVNPTTSLTVNYPPPTPTCVTAPTVQTVSTNAPAATPVSAAVITYTG
ncbi:hypothetical protein [Demequina globuliformis]|uniref:hypothetical protein n=1 Tax=Demequina globuliformis TaxID=676202 RepID=UPI0007852F66|nr:hypothetical protein [Demequina globuliformis]